jgi:SH3 domain protein
MQKIFLIYLAVLSFGFTWGAHAEDKRYVSDELSTYVHKGPGTQYRIVGSVKSGEEVTLLNVDASRTYGQIRDAKGRTVWILLNQLSQTPSMRTQLPKLEQQVKELTEKLATIDDSWNQRTVEMRQKVVASSNSVETLKQENQDLKNQLVVAQKKVDVLTLQVDDKQRAIIQQWFIYGGSVAGLGVLFGLFLPYLMPRRKKSNNRWMN